MNRIDDLNKILFDRLKAFEDDDLTEEELQREIQKTDAVVKVSDVIIKNAALALKAQEQFDLYGVGRTVDIPLLGITNEGLKAENKKLRRELYERKKVI